MQPVLDGMTVLQLLAALGAGLCAGLCALLAFWTAKLLVRHAWYTHRMSCFSRPHARSWLLGHLGQMQSTEEGLLQVEELVQMFTYCCSWFIGPFYHLLRVFHPDYVKPLLTASASITVKDELIYGHLRPWLGGAELLLSNGEVWLRKRRLLTPAFHFDILKNYVAKFNTSTNTMHDKWRRLAAEGPTHVEAFEDVTLMTLDSLLKCAFSYDSDCQQSSSEYASAIVQLSDLIIERRQRILHHWDWIYWRTRQGKRFQQALSIVHKFTRDVVQERRTLIGQKGEMAAQGKKDFVDIILLSKDEDGKGLTDEEIQAEANTFMFAGHDTTASAICWSLYNLARHDHYQEKCRKEVMDLMEGRDVHEINWEDLSSLPFTTMCIRESLRLHSPVQAVTRRYLQDVELPGGHTVPEGAICLVSIYGTHHNPAVWTNPHDFDPLRFDPTNQKGLSSHAFIPFSSGPRNCIGQKFALAELRVVVALTLLRFRLSPGRDPRLGTTSGKVRRLPQLVLRAEGGLWLQVEPVTPAQ
uniref:aromatase n=1 Tax=Tetraodon nigroviridis TaxID=99883 RepID=H3DID8_TETNG